MSPSDTARSPRWIASRSPSTAARCSPSSARTEQADPPPSVRLVARFIQPISPWLPTYHLSQLMEHVFGYQDPASLTTHWLGLIGFTVLMLGASWLLFSRSRQDA